MSRFNNFKTVRAVASAGVGPTSGAAPAVAAAPLSPAAPISRRLPGLTRPTIIQSIGFFVLCAFFISGHLNDWALRYTGVKTYISTVALIVLPIAWLASGSALRGLGHRVGKYWLGFLVCLLVSTAFSVYKTGSIDMLTNYIPRSYLFYFYLTALAAGTRQVRRLLMVTLLGNAFLLFECWKFGIIDPEGRLAIPDSSFFSNSNDLALALVIAATQFTFLFFGGRVFSYVLGVAGMFGSLYYLVRTGSRGCTVAAVAVWLIVLWLTRNKLKMALVSVPVIAIALALAPHNTLARLQSIVADTSTVRGDEDLGAIASQAQREQLIRRSLYQTMIHPLLGVGPDMFVVAENGEKAKRGEYSAWLGTHNSYTEVSSECGIPAFLLYTAVLFGSMRITYRVYKRCRFRPQYRELEGLSFTVFLGLAAYAVGTFFFHMAYTGHLPLMSGMAVILYWAASRDITDVPGPAARPAWAQPVSFPLTAGNRV